MSPAAIRDALQRLLASGDFQASGRNRRFLEHVVEETLAGRASRMKAYSVATTVFGRDDAFDAQADPIVRIEASRLRRALERYYLTAGSEDQVHITIPKGSYVPCSDPAPAPPGPGDEVNAGAGDARPAVPVGPPSGWVWPAVRCRAHPALIAGMDAVVLAVSALGAWLVIPRPGGEPQAEAAAVRHGPAIFVDAFPLEGNTSAFRMSARA